MQKTLFQKIWDAHVVDERIAIGDTAATNGARPVPLYIDLHLVHEVTSPQAFTEIAARGLTVRRPDRTFATMDHSTPTRKVRSLAQVDSAAAEQLRQLEQNCALHNIPLFALGNRDQGIVHVIGPELGLTLPGMTIVCGDSHTSTHGAFGAIAFGIGTSEVAHVLATQCVLQNKPKTMRVTFTGQLPNAVSSKDMILALIAKIGIGGATGHVIEYAGETVRALDMEARMTLCNMSIEAGARAGMIAPDDTTIDYVVGRQFAPRGANWNRALKLWRTLFTDDGAVFDREVTVDVSRLQPMITFGTNPAMAIGITESVPIEKQHESALAYMAVESGKPLLGKSIDTVFIGSCTNSRLSDLRSAASILERRKVASGVRVLVVPGSQAVKRLAEAERLDQVFIDAGAEWREPGCSMCIAMNGDELSPGQYAISTSNRNFEGRQGRGGRTFLASPLTAAAAAVTGKITDPRTLL